MRFNELKINHVDGIKAEPLAKIRNDNYISLTLTRGLVPSSLAQSYHPQLLKVIKLTMKFT